MNPTDIILPELPPGYRYRKKGEFEAQSQHGDRAGDIDIFLDIPITEETQYYMVIKGWVAIKDFTVTIRNERKNIYEEKFGTMQEALNMLVLRLCLNEF